MNNSVNHGPEQGPAPVTDLIGYTTSDEWELVDIQYNDDVTALVTQKVKGRPGSPSQFAPTNSAEEAKNK